MNIVMKVPTFFFFFSGLFLRVYYKAYVALCWPLDLEKTQTRQCSSRANYHTLGRSMELKL